MTPRQVHLVQESVAAVAPQRNRLAAIFFAQLFVREPTLRAVFGKDLRAQGLDLYDGLSAITGSLDRLYPIVPALEWLAVQSACRGVGERHYAVIGEALLAALEDGLGTGFTSELRAAWTDACRRVTEVMIGALESEPLAA